MVYMNYFCRHQLKIIKKCNKDEIDNNIYESLKSKKCTKWLQFSISK